jgi:uracil-DNA glycosylase family 4
MGKTEELNSLKAEVEQCVKCPDLARSRKLYAYGKPTFGYGNPDSPIVFVGQCPGMFGCGVTGMPFTKDKSGLIYQDGLEKAGLSYSEVYTSNLVLCCPENNRMPTDKEISLCLNFLARELRIIQPRTVVSLGAIAESGIAKLQAFQGIDLKFWHFHVKHPAYYLRTGNVQAYFSEFCKVVEKARKTMNRKGADLAMFFNEKSNKGESR